tara:strand:+ start:235 stop:516 length:282 start_codon:yes stop_codon:yes gene_type:complete
LGFIFTNSALLFLIIEIAEIIPKLAIIIISESTGNLNLGDPQNGKIVINTYNIITIAGQEFWKLHLNKPKMKNIKIGMYINAITKSLRVKLVS